jgi:hypothetical protein
MSSHRHGTIGHLHGLLQMLDVIFVRLTHVCFSRTEESVVFFIGSFIMYSPALL